MMAALRTKMCHQLCNIYSIVYEIIYVIVRFNKSGAVNVKLFLFMP
jgi:hypothetical protein